jgi:hypothetical protein
VRLSETDYKDIHRRWIYLAASGRHYDLSLSVERNYDLKISYCRHGYQLDCRWLLATTESAAHVAGNAQCDRDAAATATFIDIARCRAQHAAKFNDSSVPTPDAGFPALA